MNVKIIMVEGPHDGAFLSKIMKVNGYKTCGMKISKYEPSYIAGFLKKQYQNIALNEPNVQSARQEVLFPSYSLIRNNELVLIFNMGGDSRVDKRSKLVSDFITLIRSSMVKSETENDIVSFVYELDADTVGIEKRLSQVNEEIRDKFDVSPGISKNASYTDTDKDNIRWGAFIFANDDGMGKLEDIILPMMEEGNEDIAKLAQDFVNRRDNFTLFKSTKAKPTKYPLKARVGVMGQLEKAGSPNATIIDQSSFLTDDKIKASTICKTIFKFLSE